MSAAAAAAAAAAASAAAATASQPASQPARPHKLYNPWQTLLYNFCVVVGACNAKRDGQATQKLYKVLSGKWIITK